MITLDTDVAMKHSHLFLLGFLVVLHILLVITYQLSHTTRMKDVHCLANALYIMMILSFVKLSELLYIRNTNNDTRGFPIKSSAVPIFFMCILLNFKS